MAKAKLPSTPALRLLRQHQVAFDLCPYRYVEDGGTARFAEEWGVAEHLVIKTLVMEDETQAPLVVLMHGDRSVSLKALARALGRKRISPCAPKVAERHSGYRVGGTSPLGTRGDLPVYMEASILELSEIYLNAGSRGLLVRLNPADVRALCAAQTVNVAQP